MAKETYSTILNKNDAIGVQNLDKMMEVAELIMEPEAFRQHKQILERLERAKNLKQQRYKYYDGMIFDEDYATNENLKNTFLTPKANETEVRINTGTAEKKLDTIKNELLTMNLSQEIRAHDQDDLEIMDLGEDMSSVVDRTNQIEKDDDFWEEFLDELLSQRIVYVRENFVERTYKRGQKKVQMAMKELMSGLQVFPGDWTLPAYKWDDQPYICLYNRVNYEKAKSFLGKYDNFKHVQTSNAKRDIYLSGAFSYNFGELIDGEVEIIIYESLPDDEYQIYANGVPMLPPKTKLPWSYNKYDVRAYIPKSMSRNFLAGRPFTSMAKYMQGFQNETIRMLIRKFQQALEPPLAVSKGGKIYAKTIWDPSAITQGLRKNDFEKLIDHDGVTGSEFNMYKLIEQKTEEFIGTPNISQGLQGSREMSATEVLTMQKQFIKQLGYTVAAWMKAKRDLTEMRVYNILENYTKPQRRKYDELTKEVQNVYRSFTIEGATFGNNRKGKKIVNFTDENLNPEQERELYDYEEEEAKRGNNVRIKFINTKLINKFPIFWYVVVTMKDKEGNALDKVTFTEQLGQSAEIMKITGKPVNPDVVTDEFERKWKAKDWFNVPAPQEQLGAEGGEQVQKDSEKLLGEIDKMGMEGGLGKQVSRGLRKGEESGQRNTMALEANV